MTAASKTNLKRLENDSDETRIVKSIFNAVMEQRLPPRTKLSEADLCDTFGVGRMRVRRALLLLGSQGIVDLHSNRGAFIASPTSADAKEVFEVRLMVEPELVKTLATGVSKTAIKSLLEHIKNEDEARGQGDRSTLIRLSGEFHVKLAEAHGNSVLTRMMRELVTRTSLIVGLYGRSRRSACPDDEHSQIVKAIISGDGNVAERKVKHHLQHIQESLDLDKESSPESNLSAILRGV